MKKLKEERHTFQISDHSIAWLLYGLFLLITFFLQMAPHALPAPWGIRPFPLLLVVVAVGMFEGPVGGAAVGVTAGLLWDLYSSRIYGLRALFLLAVGCACGLLVRLLIRNNLPAALLLMATASVLFGLGDWLLIYVIFGNAEPLYVLVRIVLPRIGYTLLLAPLVYYTNYGIAKLLRNRQ